jgi:peptidoglycan-N-acetylglucosamine deacetylase
VTLVTLAALVIIASAALWFLSPLAFRHFAEISLGRACRNRRAIVLSYDDGPSASLTPRLLDLLERLDVRATFFLLGRNAVAEPGLVDKLVRSGHEVGSHTQHHLNAWRAQPWAVARDVDAGVKTLESLGVPTRLFRPPFGKLTIAGVIGGARRGLRFGFWTLDSRDSWRRRPADEVISLLAEKGGGVVLMHDFAAPRRGAAADEHPAYLLDLTERLVNFARAEGFTLLRLGEVMRTSDAFATGRK